VAGVPFLFLGMTKQQAWRNLFTWAFLNDQKSR